MIAIGLRLIVFLLPCSAIAQTSPATGDALAASMAGSALRLVASLGAVLVLLVASAWFARKWRERQQVAAGAIEIVSGLSLGAKERIVLLRVGDEQILVGVSPAGMRSLHVIRDERRRFDLAMGAPE